MIRDTYLDPHIVIRSSIEVVVGPLSESVLAKLLGGTMVAEGELSVRLEEFGLLHFAVSIN